MNTRVFTAAAVALIATAAGCSSGTSNDAQVGPQPSASATVTTCQTKDLSFSLGTSEGTAGSVYQPLRLTNTGTGTCTLTGYPGVSFVTGASGDQVGAAASRNPQHAVTTVTLAPGATAESVVQVVDHMNYAPAQCKATDVSGFRVYPPGNTAAAYVPFDHSSSACSTDVTQLTVQAVTAAS